MTKCIHIGDLSLPLDDFVVARTAVLGITRSGKTYAAKGLAEQLLDAGVPIVVFDAIGVWRYLKMPGDGQRAKGYPVVVAGGAHPDLPLTPSSAPEIVRAAIRENIPLVIDLYDPKLSKADWRRIVQACFRTLLYENKGLRHVFLEEAAEYAPQKIMDGETYAEVEKLARMGGNVHVGITFINQRAQELNKAVLELCDNVILLRQRGSHAIDALEKWLDRVSPDTARAIAKALPHMTQGECWVWAEDKEDPVRTQTRPIHSLHPDRRTPGAAAPSRPAVDTARFVARLTGELHELVERAKADDPKELRKQIAALTRELAAKPAAPAAEVKTVTVPMLDEKAIAAVERLLTKADAFTKKFQVHAEELLEQAKIVSEGMDGLRTALAAARRPATVPPPRAQTAAREVPGHASQRRQLAVSTVPRVRVLHSLAWWRAAGIDTPSREQVAFAARYSVNGHFNNLVSSLNTDGLLHYPAGGALSLTETGLAEAPTVDTIPTRAALIEMVRGILRKEPLVRVFTALVAADRALSREELAAASGYSVNGHFNNLVGRLHTLGIADYPSGGMVRLGAVFESLA